MTMTPAGCAVARPAGEVGEMAYRLRKGRVLLLRTCNADMTSHGGFVWPRQGPVEAPDWDSRPICGGGLHGLLWGEGDASLLSWESDSVGVVWEAVRTDVVSIGYDKAKAAKGTVVFTGTLREACAWLAERAPGRSIPALTQTAGENSTQTAGWNSTQTAGENSTQKAGWNSTQTAGWNSTQTAGWNSTQTAGGNSTQTAGWNSTQTAGEGSVIIQLWWNGSRYVNRIAEVGEGGLKPNTPYRLNNQGEFVEVAQ